MTEIHINIGSNSGHREALIERAVAAVTSAFGGDVKCSDVIETPPWGFDSPNPFLNVGVKITLSRPDDTSEKDDGVNEAFAAEVFAKLMEIQRAIDPSPHRDEAGQYIDRAVDIDLIAIDDLVLETESLTLPHPRMHLRNFVLIPLAGLAPTWRHPILGKSAAEIMVMMHDL